MQCAIRADSSTRIGSGHVMRCIALAQALQDAGHTVDFICREHEGNLSNLIEKNGFYTHRLARNGVSGSAPESGLGYKGWLGVTIEEDAAETIEVLNSMDGVEWLIVDHYALGEQWESLVKPYTGRVMVIDDLADRRHQCDILLDQNFVHDYERRYDGLVPQHCKMLLGPGYSLLRPEFRKIYEESSDRLRRSSVSRLLISFGGSDNSNQTVKALEAVGMLGKCDILIDVVIGAANPNSDLVARQCAEYSNVSLHHQSDNMAEIMIHADIAIGGSGSMTWERCALGLPSVIIGLNSHQHMLAKEVDKKGAAIYLGDKGDVTSTMVYIAINDLISNPDKLQAISERSLRLVSVNGAERVCRLLQGVLLRKVGIDSGRQLLSWANDDVVRKSAFRSEPITWEEHLEWLQKKLQDPDCLFFIAYFGNVPVGQIRFDLHGDEAVIDISVAPEYRKGGYGQMILEQGLRELFSINPAYTAVAMVKAHNTASSKLFQRVGFEEKKADTDNVLRYELVCTPEKRNVGCFAHL